MWNLSQPVGKTSPGRHKIIPGTCLCKNFAFLWNNCDTTSSLIPPWICGRSCFLWIKLSSDWTREWLLVFILLSVLGEQRKEADGSSSYVPSVYAGELQVGCHILLHPSRWVNACEEFKMFPSAKRGRARQGEELGGFVLTNNCNYFRKGQKCKPEQHKALPRSDISAQGKTTKGGMCQPQPLLCSASPTQARDRE